jgi:hypothetical protein
MHPAVRVPPGRPQTEETCMSSLSALWLPILLSSLAVFIASSVIHMALPWHKNDYSPVPKEDAVMDALRPFALAPGDYALPRPQDMAQMRSPEFLAKQKRGPVVVMTVLPDGPMAMNRSLALWFIYSAVVGLFAGYVTGVTLARGAPYLRVFQVAGTVAFAGYALALWPMTIWYGRSWIATAKSNVDALIYACLTAGIFGWLWR